MEKIEEKVSRFKREKLLNEIKDISIWDVIVIGGGATGLGTALDAASRGYKTLLLEQADFAKGTSSRSTKLVHGGVRYLAQGNIGMVFEALHERGLFLKNAPHLVHMQPFIIPAYSRLKNLFYTVGLKIYDWMAWRYRFKKTKWLAKNIVGKLLPNIKTKGLKGGVIYYDGQFDDARMAVNLAQTCACHGGVVLNYMKVYGLLKDEKGKVSGVEVCDLETGEEYRIKSRTVVNATGVFVDEILHMDIAAHKPLVRPSQGVHVVLDSSFLQGDHALMIPKTSDGRVLFALPWHGHVLVGTTDTLLNKHSLEPTALEHEITFILETAGQYMEKIPARKDVLSVFAGLRPLAAPDKKTGSTKEISRSHKLMVAMSGLITITGGKWTTYRKMAEDTVDEAIKIGKLLASPCITSETKIHGYSEINTPADHLNIYGSDAEGIRQLAVELPEHGQKLHGSFPNIQAEVVWAVQHEMARTVEDVLARRMRILFLDAKAAIDMAPKVADIIAAENGHNMEWQQKQINDFVSLANSYLLEPYIPLFIQSNLASVTSKIDNQ